jgi:hypothetical protein
VYESQPSALGVGCAATVHAPRTPGQIWVFLLASRNSFASTQSAHLARRRLFTHLTRNTRQGQNILNPAAGGPRLQPTRASYLSQPEANANRQPPAAGRMGLLPFFFRPAPPPPAPAPKKIDHHIQHRSGARHQSSARVPSHSLQCPFSGVCCYLLGALTP